MLSPSEPRRNSLSPLCEFFWAPVSPLIPSEPFELFGSFLRLFTNFWSYTPPSEKLLHSHCYVNILGPKLSGLEWNVSWSLDVFGTIYCNMYVCHLQISEILLSKNTNCPAIWTFMEFFSKTAPPIFFKIGILVYVYVVFGWSFIRYTVTSLE